MNTIALAALETAINAYLKLDPDTMARLPKLADKVIRVEITDWRIELYILPHADGLSLLAEYDGDVDTSMRADLCSFVNIAQAKGDTESLFKNNLHIEGDAHTGELLRDILGKIDIDWEEHFAKITNDVIAHNVFSALDKLCGLAKRSGERMRQNISEYVREEKRLTPSQIEVEDFTQDVRHTRDAVERVEARLNLLLAEEQA